ncbi:MAG: prohibitin family protein [Hydrogenibacillus schlegelii]|uniref:Prohibitin family protein n=1 Tax=Hydrogenibacillus schlegelii TaxID=1484 RepID=A0A947GHI7_HYDSH|nr:prohibitin family protein [Hydrogenibacillus schlegelii]
MTVFQEARENVVEVKVPKPPAVRFLAVLIGIAAVAAGLLALSVTTVPAGHKGVLLQFGAVRGVWDEGLHFKIPFAQNVVLMDVRVQKSETDAAASSKDLQVVKSTVVLNYHIDPDRAADVYQRLGVDFASKVVNPSVQEVFKAITARYTAEELITLRQKVSEETKALLAERLRPYGIVVDGYNIVNFDFSEEFNKAVEEKLTAEQKALKAQRDLERVKVEAQQKIEQAKAEAEALRIQREQITPELLRLREIEVQRMAVEKWDGKLPNVTGGAVPFLPLPEGR